jgi:8-oxo-dGTP pyrophosphatase MutT (NUDIX family)
MNGFVSHTAGQFYIGRRRVVSRYNRLWMLLVSEVTRRVEAFEAQSDGEALKSKDLVLALLGWSPEPFSRDTFTPGHVTCTGLVLSPNKDQILLVHHRRLDRWLLPGGHCESDDLTIASVAQREVLEETGAVLVDKAAPLVGIDVHPIPAKHREPLHLHHDLIFAFQAQNLATECSEESRAVRWCPLADFDHYELPAPIRRAALRALA